MASRSQLTLQLILMYPLPTGTPVSNNVLFSAYSTVGEGDFAAWYTTHLLPATGWHPHSAPPAATAQALIAGLSPLSRIVVDD